MSEIELKPCPFCGGEAESYYHLNGTVEISCSSNECEVRPTLIRADDGSANKAWNTRADGWIGVGDRLPDEFVNVLIKKKYEDCILIGWVARGEWIEQCEHLDIVGNAYAIRKIANVDGDAYPVTHWMPLPEPPK